MSSDADLLTKLEQAIEHGDHRLVVVLLDQTPRLLDGRFADNIGLTPLMWACRNRRDGIVAELLRRGADVASVNRIEPNGDGGNTALWFAAQGAAAGTTGVAARLLAAGAEVNRQCEYGQTALYIAAAWVHLDLVQLLVGHGGNASIPDRDGRTPLAMLRATAEQLSPVPPANDVRRRFLDGAPRVTAFLESLAR